jgi:hypothetical protein
VRAAGLWPDVRAIGHRGVLRGFDGPGPRSPHRGPAPQWQRHACPDLTPPETELDGASTPPVHSRLTSARFRFSSEPGASFQCSLDDAAFTPCISPQDYAALSDAPHTFQVRAIDTADNVDPTPAEYHWTVDTVPPPRPDFQVPRPNEEFLFSPPTFSGTTEPSSTVRVLVDDTAVGEALANEGGAWELIIPSPLAWGTHKVTATATDLAGNTSEPSMEVSFVIKRGLYAEGGSCSAGPSAWVPWPWALVLLGLLRRRRPH